MSDARTWDSVFDGPPIAFDDPAIVAERRARSSHGRHGRTKRRDIQGLRMVAVVAVVINHLTGHPQGGFVGVDVFFVISGFLITGHLLREHGKSGTISLLDFYKRRIRRLFPAALTVTLGTVLAGYLVFTQQRFHDTVTDALWATLFGANWRFINIGTDYFAAAGPVSPLQHYWSLSVEEQFYVVWPLAILTALLLARALAPRRPGARSSAAFLAGAVLTGASLVVAIAQSTSDPVVAYFSTFTRGWELGLGAVLAVLSQTERMRRISNRVLTTSGSWLGLVLIVVSLFVVNQNHFPFPGALLPCLGSALVIIAWSERAPSKNFVLTNRLSNYLGDISYSIYVVHFPVIIFAGVLVTKTSFASDVAVLLLVLSLSMVLFHLIEDPIRRSNWLAPLREQGAYVTSARLSGRSVLVGLASGVCSLAVFVLIPTAGTAQYNDIVSALQSPQATGSPSAATGNPAVSRVTVKDTSGPKVVAFDKQLKSALLAQSWPSLTPALGEHVASLNRQCGLALRPAADCTWGDKSAKKVIYLVGDSTSEAYTQAFASMMKQLPGWRMRAAGGSGCPFADRVLKDGPHTPGCGKRNDAVLAEIKKVRPDIVVSTSGVGNLAGTDSQSILAELDKIKGSVGTIVMLPPNPILPDPNTCYTKFSKPADCAGQVDTDYKAWLNRNSAMAAEVHGKFVDPTAWYCVDGYCPAFVDNVPMRKDAIHITDQYAQLLGPLVLESFQHGKLLGSG